MVKNISKSAGQRPLRVGEMIRRVLSELLSRGEIHDPAFDSMPITVGEVVVSPDLRIATVHVMPLLGKGSVEEAIAALSRHKGIIRKKISEEVILRNAPDLRFRPDETYDRMEATRKLFSDPVVQRDIAKPEEPDAP